MMIKYEQKYVLLNVDICCNLFPFFLQLCMQEFRTMVFVVLRIEPGHFQAYNYKRESLT